MTIIRTLVALSTLFGIGLSSAQAELIVATTQKIQGKNGVVTHISVTGNRNHNSLKYDYIGVIRSVQFNADRSIGAINLKPGTETNEIHLLQQRETGKITIMKDFNKKIASQFHPRSGRLFEDYIYVDRIDDSLLRVSSGTKGSDCFSFSVRVLPTGEVAVVGNSIVKGSR